MSKLKGSTYKNKDIIYIRKKTKENKALSTVFSSNSETQPEMKSEAKQTPEAPFYLLFTYVQLSV